MNQHTRRLHTDLPIKENRPGFISSKCSRPIHYPRRYCRDALVQASLDPLVEEMAPALINPCLPKDCILAFTVRRKDTLGLVAVCDRTDGVLPNGPAAEYHMVMATNRDRILAEPFATAARTIWSRRSRQVHPTFVVETLSVIRNHEGCTSLGMLGARRHRNTDSWLDDVLAMACGAIVNISIDGPLTDTTLITLGRNSGPDGIDRTSAPLRQSA